MSAGRLAIAAVATLALLAACADDDQEDGSSPPPTASTATSADASTTSMPSTTTAAPSTTASGPGTTAAPATSAAPTTTRLSTRPPRVRAELIAQFEQPVAMAPVPARPGVWYVVEKEGRIRTLSGRDAGPVVLDIVADVSSGGERGLLGLAVAPDGRHLYLNYTNRDGDTRIVEYAVGAGGAIDAGSRRELLAVDQPYANHNGGHLAFGPDGFLYIALGDGGSGGDPHDNAQRLTTLLGKILRIDPSGSPYRVPADNPFVDTENARAEIWAYGLRNPWRFSFDRSGGTLWIGDVGQSRKEEIDRAPEGSRGGENYGWNRLEGRDRFSGSPPAEHVLPLHDYARDDGNCAVTGGEVYRGGSIAGLQGWYLFGDYCKGAVLAIRSDAAAPAPSVAVGATVPSLASFADDGTGELFALSLQGGIYRLVGG